MKKRIKKKSLKNTAKDLRLEIKRLEEEKEKRIYEIAELDYIKEEIENDKFREDFNKHYGFIKKLVG